MHSNSVRNTISSIHWFQIKVDVWEKVMECICKCDSRNERIIKTRNSICSMEYTIISNEKKTITWQIPTMAYRRSAYTIVVLLHLYGKSIDRLEILKFGMRIFSSTSIVHPTNQHFWYLFTCSEMLSNSYIHSILFFFIHRTLISALLRSKQYLPSLIYKA